MSNMVLTVVHEKEHEHALPALYQDTHDDRLKATLMSWVKISVYASHHCRVSMCLRAHLQNAVLC